MTEAAAALASHEQQIALRETIQETLAEAEVTRQVGEAAMRAEMLARPAGLAPARARLINRAPASSSFRARPAPTRAAPARAAPVRADRQAFVSSSGRPSAAAGQHRHVAYGLERSTPRAGASAATATGVRRQQPVSAGDGHPRPSAGPVLSPP